MSTLTRKSPLMLASRRFDVVSAVGTGYVTNSNSTGNQTSPAPAGRRVGDFLFVAAASGNNFTKVGSNYTGTASGMGTGVFWRIADGTSNDDFVFNYSSAGNPAVVFVVAYAIAAAPSSVQIHPSGNESAANTASALPETLGWSSATWANAGAEIRAHAAYRSNQTGAMAISTPAGYTRLFESNVDNVSSLDYSITVDRIARTAGATGAVSSTVSGSGNRPVWDSTAYLLVP